MKFLIAICMLVLTGCAIDPAAREANRQTMLQMYQAGWRPYQAPAPQQPIHCHTVGSETYCNNGF